MEEILRVLLVFILTYSIAYFLLKKSFLKKIEDIKIVISDIKLLAFVVSLIPSLITAETMLDSTTYSSWLAVFIGILFTALIAGLQDLFNTVQSYNSQVLEARINAVYLNLSKDYSVEPNIQDEIKRIETFVLLAKSKIVDNDKEKAALIDLDIALKLLANYQLPIKKKL